MVVVPLLPVGPTGNNANSAYEAVAGVPSDELIAKLALTAYELLSGKPNGINRRLIQTHLRK